MATWNGVGEDYLLWSDRPIQAWEELLPQLEYWGFDTVRLSFAFPDAPPRPEGGYTHNPIDFNRLDQVLELLSSHGIKGILDCHNYNDHEDWFGSEAWIDDWVRVARRFKGDDRILAYELYNEPEYMTWHEPDVTSRADVLSALAKCKDAIRAIGDMHIIVYSDPYYYDYAKPTDRWNIVTSFHAWATQANTVEGAQNHASQVIQAMSDWSWITKVWLGEFGAIYDWDDYLNKTERWRAQKAFVVDLVDFSLANKSGFSWWLYSNKIGPVNELMAQTRYMKPAAPMPLWQKIAIGGILGGIIVGGIGIASRR